MMDVLFDYSSSEYRCIIYAQKSKLCWEIEHHLSLAEVAKPEVAVLSHTLCGSERKYDGRTEFFAEVEQRLEMLR